MEEAAVGDIGVEAGHGLGKVPAQGRRGEELQAGGLHLMIVSKSVLRIRIRIHRIRMFLGLPDPAPDPLVRGMDPEPVPDPSVILQK
jgi:hypothetical protein